jgi:hypothetical protein
VHEALNQAVQAIELHKKVLTTEASNVESLACLAAFQVSGREREGVGGGGRGASEGEGRGLKSREPCSPRCLPCKMGAEGGRGG